MRRPRRPMIFQEEIEPGGPGGLMQTEMRWYHDVAYF
jgi:hypothetical protein